MNREKEAKARKNGWLPSEEFKPKCLHGNFLGQCNNCREKEIAELREENEELKAKLEIATEALDKISKSSYAHATATLVTMNGLNNLTQNKNDNDKS